MDAVLAYKEACAQKNTKPLPEIIQALTARDGECVISPAPNSFLTESDLTCFSSVLRGGFLFIRELKLTGQRLSKAHIAALSCGLQNHAYLAALDLSNNAISAAESLFPALSSLRQLEAVDLSHNQITGEAVQGICDVIEDCGVLRSVVLDYNSIGACDIPLVISKNESLVCFSISNNPLTFECVNGFLDALVNNRALRYMGLAGCPMEGPAPIKENCNGLLSKKEVVVLKLAHVLRYSSISSIAIDLDSDAEVQLQELESTLVKHNRTLTSLRCPAIDWLKLKSSGPLSGIYRALRANQWLSQNEQLPRDQQSELSSDISELVAAKFRRRGADTDSSLSSSENFQRMLVGKYMRSSSPTVLHSCDSTAPVVGSPDTKPSYQLQELGAMDVKSLGVMAETPQFSPYTSSQSFARKSQARAKRNSDYDSAAMRMRSPVTDKRREYSADMTLQTEPAPLNSSVDSRSPGKDQKRQGTDVSGKIAQIERNEQALNRNMKEIADKLTGLEMMGLRQREEILETQGSLTETQRIVKEMSARFDCPSSRSDVSLIDRFEAMERKEAAKVAIFEEIAKELDSLKAAQEVANNRIQMLESHLREGRTKEESLMKIHSEKVAMLERQLEAYRSKANQPMDIALVTEQLNLHRQEREDDRELILSRLEAVEGREIQIEKIKRYVTVLQKDVSSKVRKSDSTETAIKRLEAKVAALEESAAKGKEESCLLKSLPVSPPISSRADTGKVSELEQIGRLEERVSDLEKEVSNFSSMKRKLIDTLKRLKSLESSLRSPRRQSEAQEAAKLIQKSRDPSQSQGLSPKSIRSTLTASKLLETVAYGSKGGNRVATQPDEEVETSFGVGDKEFRTERELSDFLPGEAESVVMSALLERSRRPKPGSSDLRFRSISPLLTQAQKTVRHVAGPSVDLQDYLRQKGFSFS